ncbi:MAG: cell shape-determining protein MreB [Pedobacter sp.]|nr:MAG: cell shape-determining protein MreB [Pedobacter sp.]
MKNFKVLLATLSIAAISLASCSNNDDEPVIVEPAAPETIPASVTANKTLTADRVWILKGETHVVSPAVLTIEAGTVIKSDVSSKGALVVDKGAKIEAVGTVDKPIVFTSGRPVGERNPGDWSGITIIGNAPTNRTSISNVEGGVSGTFGLGTASTESSGTLKYVRIEYAGTAFSSNSEVNALSLYAVGSGTTLDHIQVSYAQDDAFEFFGGTVNGKYLIAYGTKDDDFDFDFGYSGKLQFCVSYKLANYSDKADQSNGIECDNEGTVPATGPSGPITKPILSNFTFVGTNGNDEATSTNNFAVRFRRGTRFALHNSVLIGYKLAGFSIESSYTAADYVAGTSTFKNNLVHAVANPYNSGDAGAQGVITAAAMKTKAELEGSVTLTAATDAGLKAPFTATQPDLVPNTGSQALAGTWVSPDGSSFFTAVTYRGAFSGTDNWSAGWTNFNPGQKVY